MKVLPEGHKLEEVTHRDEWLQERYDNETEESKKWVLGTRERMKKGVNVKICEKLKHMDPEEATPYVMMMERSL